MAVVGRAKWRTNDRTEERRDSWDGKSEGERNKNVECDVSFGSFPGHCSLHFPLQSIQTLYAHAPSSPFRLAPLASSVYRVLDACFSRPRVCWRCFGQKGRQEIKRIARLKRVLTCTLLEEIGLSPCVPSSDDRYPTDRYYFELQNAAGEDGELDRLKSKLIRVFLVFFLLFFF